MKPFLCFETTIEANPEELELADYVKEKLSPAKQKVNFRILCTANRHTFDEDDVLCLRYTSLDDKGEPRKKGDLWVPEKLAEVPSELFFSEGTALRPPPEDGATFKPLPEAPEEQPETPEEQDEPPEEEDPKYKKLYGHRMMMDIEGNFSYWAVGFGFKGFFGTFEEHVSFLLKNILGFINAKRHAKKVAPLELRDIIDETAYIAQKRLVFRQDPCYVTCDWELTTENFRNLFRSPSGFRPHYQRHLYWYLSCHTAQTTKLSNDTSRLLIAKQPFVEPGKEYTVESTIPIEIPGPAFFNTFVFSCMDEDGNFYDFDIPYDVEWRFLK